MKASKSVNIPMNNRTGWEFKRVLNRLPDEARISVHVTKGDRPWESDAVDITIRWNEEL